MTDSAPGSTVVGLLEQLTDPNGNVHKTHRDGRGRIVAVTKHATVGTAAKDLTTTYQYDALDRVTKVTDALSKVTTAVWDSFDHLVSLTGPDTGTVQWFYDPEARVVAKQTPNLTSTARIKYAYEQNRLKTITYPSPTSLPVTFTYGAALAMPDGKGTQGRVAQRDDESGTEKFEYDKLGAIVKRTRKMFPKNTMPQLPDYVTQYQYDEVLGRIKSMTFDDGEIVNYTYDTAGQLSSVSSSLNTYVTKITYDEQGSRKSIQYGNGVQTIYTYDAMRQMRTITTTTAASKSVQAISYAKYDANGNVLTLNNAAPVTGPTNGISTAPTTQLFTYDELNQLKTGDGTYTMKDTLGVRKYSVKMTYDEIGNIKTKNQSDTTQIGTATPTKNQATTYNWAYAYPTTSHAHQPTTVTESSVTPNVVATLLYDTDGNLKSSSGGRAADTRTLTWNEEDRLTAVSGNGHSTTFLYGGDGERSHKRADMGELVYPNANYVVKTGNTVLQRTKHITIGEERIASVMLVGSNPSVTFWYHSDNLHSSNYVTNDAANLVQHAEYLPSGETWVSEIRNASPANTTPTPYAFNAKELDESGLYYFGARYYDPRMQMWASADPILADYMRGKTNSGVFAPRNLALYTYGWNNPVVMSDPDGRQAEVVQPPPTPGLPIGPGPGGGTGPTVQGPTVPLVVLLVYAAELGWKLGEYDAENGTILGMGGKDPPQSAPGAPGQDPQHAPGVPAASNISAPASENNAPAGLPGASSSCCASAPGAPNSGDMSAAMPRQPGVPLNWVAKPSKTGGGTRFVDPANPHNSVRVMPGDPTSPFPNSRQPYVRHLNNGQSLDVNGNVVPKNTAAAHIPLGDFKGVK